MSQELQAKFEATRRPGSVQYLQALRETPLVNELSSGLALEWADTTLVCDDPAKTLDEAEDPRALMLTQLARGRRSPDESVRSGFSYFVPKKRA